MEVPGSEYKTKEGGKINLEVWRRQLEAGTEDITEMKAFSATNRANVTDESIRERMDGHEEVTGMKGHHGCERCKAGQKSREQEHASSRILTEQT